MSCSFRSGAWLLSVYVLAGAALAAARTLLAVVLAASTLDAADAYLVVRALAHTLGHTFAPSVSFNPTKLRWVCPINAALVSATPVSGPGSHTFVSTFFQSLLLSQACASPFCWQDGCRTGEPLEYPGFSHAVALLLLLCTHWCAVCCVFLLRHRKSGCVSFVDDSS